ncbi:hypothetical protein OLMES_5100 [Oleiphilus messinensis]|uniref:Uncharacterized protein n=1 Tax=Oleiphilus messinensis TaxID=141451 RepID=A0A1Y0II61_9GAMM|nr:hypothetical protein OLMES_5100 [Oleiphilus messinensis]
MYLTLFNNCTHLVHNKDLKQITEQFLSVKQTLLSERLHVSGGFYAGLKH